MTYIVQNTPGNEDVSELKSSVSLQSGWAESFDKLSPKSVFMAGLVSGILMLCTIGFFILLSFFIKNGG